MIDAGRMRDTLVIQRFNGAVDDLGDLRSDAAGNWVNVGTCWGAVDSLSAREFLAADQSHSEVSLKVIIRYRSDVKPGYRLLLGTRILHIVGVLDWQNRHESLTLMCREVTT